MTQPFERYEVQPNGCWLWTGYVCPNGYPGTSKGGKKGHVSVYTRHNGEVPPGLVLDHLCRNPRCVNPEHLQAVSQAENVRRGASTKLTVTQVSEIRRRYSEGETQRSIAADFSVHRVTVSKIVCRLRWKDI